MEDIEIYELASQVLGDITKDMNNGRYAKLGGQLTLTWHGGKKFGAYASTLSDASEPPRHCITIHYELVRQVWRDAEGICKFLRIIPADSDVDKLYDIFGDRVKLPTCFNEEELVRNMFVAAITWVFFHEIGHLMQEHGVIRKEFGPDQGNCSSTIDVQDFEASAHNRIVGREALVSHVTELAADFEANNSYVFELLRHIRSPQFVKDEKRTEVLSGLLYLMVCGMSLLFFRFNGSLPLLPTSDIEGSHPNPLIRLEINIPQIFEALDGKVARAITPHDLDRKQLVSICGKAALSATIYWSMTQTDKHAFDERFLLKGLLSNPVLLEYFQPVVACWDEMLPRVKEVRRFGSPLGLMHFTEQFRQRIKDLVTWGNGPEGNLNTHSP
ncbi:hypothetical protein [Comamonas sp. wu1-DMT]|uniref:hypothetical protein n=1 Tax=Comamonas sp. wu1-DMT TaxID=3126390 RepID=UPI0032E3783A